MSKALPAGVKGAMAALMPMTPQVCVTTERRLLSNIVFVQHAELLAAAARKETQRVCQVANVNSTDQVRSTPLFVLKTTVDR
jgi:hypothetical protein